MQTNEPPTLESGLLSAHARKLRALLTRINALQALFVDGEEHENTPDLRELRQGLNMLEHMASDMLYSLQEAGSTILLADLPAGTLAEMLSVLVESTAESLSLSSR